MSVCPLQEAFWKHFNQNIFSDSSLKLILSGDIKYCENINADMNGKFTRKSEKTYITLTLINNLSELLFPGISTSAA